MKKVKCVVSYDGSHYHGWQIQPFQSSIQQVIESALSKIHKHEVKIYGAGRTDKGVSAIGQVFHFDSELNMTSDQYYKAINALLPADIYVRQVNFENDDFHARFSARGKWYRYSVNCGEYNPLEVNYCLQLNQTLDIEKMRLAGQILVGQHDFTAFNATPLDEISDQVRTITKIAITRQDDKVILDFEGDGFLRYMVRMLTQTLIEVGLGKLSVDQVKSLLDSCDKNAHSYLAKASGLTLMAVIY